MTVVGDVYISASQIAARVAELGAEITRDYADGDLILIGSLKASVVFLADLSRAITIPHSIDTVELAGFRGDAEQTAHGAQLLKDVERDLGGRDVLIVEDIVDTGLTLAFLERHIAGHRPRSFAVATLLDRPYRRLVDNLPLRYVGFTVPDEFFVGYGFDLDERFRNLPDIHLLPPA
jgi:hypoxanthine phosphoribosyltransferase